VIQHLKEWNLGIQVNEEEIMLFPALARWNGDYSSWTGGNE